MFCFVFFHSKGKRRVNTNVGFHQIRMLMCVRAAMHLAFSALNIFPEQHQIFVFFYWKGIVVIISIQSVFLMCCSHGKLIMASWHNPAYLVCTYVCSCMTLEQICGIVVIFFMYTLMFAYFVRPCICYEVSYLYIVSVYHLSVMPVKP